MKAPAAHFGTALGTASGTLTITDNAGTQTTSLIGTGIAPVTLSSCTLNLAVRAATV